MPEVVWPILASTLARLDRLLLWLALAVFQPLIGVLRALQARLLDSPAEDAPSDDPSAPPLLFFESSGLFLPYYLGVADYLKEDYELDAAICAGVSGGYAAASTIALGLTTETHWAAIEGMRRLGQKRVLGTFAFTSRDMIHNGYLPLLKKDHARYLELRERLAQGRFYLGATSLWPWPGTSVWAGGDEMPSAKALCHAATCSMRVPPIFFRPGKLLGRYVIDGFLACRPACLRHHLRTHHGLAPLGATITVSAVPSSTASVSPAALLGGLSAVVLLPSRETFDAWMAAGRSDAAVAAQRGVFEAAHLRRRKR